MTGRNLNPTCPLSTDLLVWNHVVQRADSVGNVTFWHQKEGGVQAGIDYDLLQVDGEAVLEGTLEISLIDGFEPARGDVFDILEFNEAVSGAFDEIVLPQLGRTLSWDASGLYTMGTVSVVPEPAGVFLVAVGLLLFTRVPVGSLGFRYQIKQTSGGLTRPAMQSNQQCGQHGEHAGRRLRYGCQQTWLVPIEQHFVELGRPYGRSGIRTLIDPVCRQIRAVLIPVEQHQVEVICLPNAAVVKVGETATTGGRDEQHRWRRRQRFLERDREAIAVDHAARNRFVEVGIPLGKVFSVR